MNKTLDTIDALLDEEFVVNVRGKQVTLTAPSVAAVKDINALVAKQLTATDEDDKSKGLELGNEMSILAITACIPGLTREKAERLLPMSGGAFSNLANTARSLCGLDQDQLNDRLDKRGDGDRPT